MIPLDTNGISLGPTLVPVMIPLDTNGISLGHTLVLVMIPLETKGGFTGSYTGTCNDTLRH